MQRANLRANHHQHAQGKQQPTTTSTTLATPGNLIGMQGSHQVHRPRPPSCQVVLSGQVDGRYPTQGRSSGQDQHQPHRDDGIPPTSREQGSKQARVHGRVESGKAQLFQASNRMIAGLMLLRPTRPNHWLRYSQERAPPVWYSVTRVSKKFFSLRRLACSSSQGRAFSAPGKGSSMFS